MRRTHHISHLGSHHCLPTRPGIRFAVSEQWLREDISQMGRKNLLGPESLASRPLSFHLQPFQIHNLLQWKSHCIRWPKHWSFIFSISTFNEYSVDFLQDWFICSPCNPRNYQESSPAPQFESFNSLVAQSSLWSSSHICTWLLEKPWFW